MKNHINLILFLTILLIKASGAFAAPSISDVTGTLSDGTSITISGSNFGTNSAVGTSSLQWLGANIESGTNGAVFSASGWENKVDSEDSENCVPRYTTVQAHSGNKSIVVDYASGRYKGHFKHDFGNLAPGDDIYFTWWVRAAPYTVGGTNAQWKQFRISTDNDTVDDFPEFFQGSGKWGRESHLRTSSTSDYWYSSRENHNGSLYMSDADLADDHFNTWVRYEYYAKMSSVGSENGSFLYWFHLPGVRIRNPMTSRGYRIDFVDNLQTYSSSRRWRYIILGSAFVDAGGKTLTTYWDDVYVQKGTQARVEIGDNSTWSSNLHREIQVPTAWSNNSITITVNRGSFDPCETLYLFVVDADGNVNTEGYPIRIVTGAGEAPCPPVGLQIQ